MKSEVITSEELDTSKRTFFNDILSFSNDINSARHSILGNSSIINVGWSDCFRTFIDQFKDNEAAIKNLVISSLSLLNKTSPDSIELYIRSLIDKTSISRYHRASRRSSSDILGDISSNGDSYILNNFATLVECLNVAGAGGHIAVNIRSDILHRSIAVTEGFKVNCTLDEFFYEYLGDMTIEGCKVLIVNGKIIDIGEIHHVLQSSFETGQRYILVSTGLSDDVSNTLFVNWQQGKTNVIPFQISDDVESINEIKDIAVVTGTTPCSADMGNRLSSLDLGSLLSCGAQYHYQTGVLRLSPCKETTGSINKLRAEIKDKISKSTADDVKQLLQSRLSKLNLRSVHIDIPGEYGAKGILEDKINSFFSHVTRCASQGAIDVRSLYYDDYHTRFLPASDSLTAIKRAESDRKAIDNIRAVIRMEQV